MPKTETAPPAAKEHVSATVKPAIARAHGGQVQAEVGETWRDWLPEQLRDGAEHDLITRQELLATLRDQYGISMTGRTLQNWEVEGWIPRPTRRWSEGAVRALYPSWMPQFVVAARSAKSLLARHQPPVDPRPYLEALARAFAIKTASDIDMPVFLAGLEEALEPFIERYETAGGLRPRQVEIRLYDELGLQFEKFVIPTPETNRKK